MFIRKYYKESKKSSQALKNAIIVFGGSVVSNVLSGIAAVIIIRFVTKSEYGQITIFQTTIALAAGVIMQGLNWALIRQAASGGKEIDKNVKVIIASAIYVQTFVVFIILIMGWVAAPMIGDKILREPNVVYFIRCGLVAMIGTVYTQLTASVLQANKRFVLSSGILIVGAVLCLVSILCMLSVRQLTLMKALTLYVITPYGGAIVGFICIRPYWELSKYDSNVIKMFIHDSRWMLAYTFILWAYSRVDIILLTRFRTLNDVAIYGVANRIYSIALLGLHAINTVLLPHLASYKGPHQLRMFMEKYFRMGIPAALLFLIISIISSPVCISIVAGWQYMAAVPILRILFVSATVSILFSPMVNVLLSLGRVRLVTCIGVVFMIVGLGTQAVCTSRYGVTGTAYATFISYAVLNCMFAYASYRLTAPSRQKMQ
jgi:O-antigen/teichoic acid export membrane protein